MPNSARHNSFQIKTEPVTTKGHLRVKSREYIMGARSQNKEDTFENYQEPFNLRLGSEAMLHAEIISSDDFFKNNTVEELKL